MNSTFVPRVFCGNAENTGRFFAHIYEHMFKYLENRGKQTQKPVLSKKELQIRG